jgi:hypothetical protein
MKVENSHFTLHLPDEWKERANVDGVEWVTPDGTQQVIVSVVLPKKGADLRQALDTLMTIRQQQVAKLGGAGQLLPTGIKAESDSWIGTMVGAEAARRVLMFVRFVATPVRIVTASVYQYGTLDDPKGFGARAEDICSTLTVSRELAKAGWRRFLPW